MRRFAATLALTLLLAAPAAAEGGLPAAGATPQLSPAQLQALKRQLDASPQTPGRAAMMQKLLKLALAMKNKQPVATEDMMALVAFLRASNADKGSNPAFEGAMQQLESGILRIQGTGDNPDLDDLKKEFEGY